MRAVTARLFVTAICLSAAGCASADNAIPSAPYFAEVPSVLPVAVATAGGCLVPGRTRLDGGSGFPLVWVNPHPTSVTTLRFPGTQGPCAVVRSDYGLEMAMRLARLADEIKPFPSGTFNCPSDDGQFTSLYFHYRDAAPSEVVEVKQSGCGGVTAPGRSFGISPQLGIAVSALESN